MISQLSGIYRLSAGAVFGLAVGFLVMAMPAAGGAYAGGEKPGF